MRGWREDRVRESSSLPTVSFLTMTPPLLTSTTTHRESLGRGSHCRVMVLSEVVVTRLATGSGNTVGGGSHH